MLILLFYSLVMGGLVVLFGFVCVLDLIVDGGS